MSDTPNSKRLDENQMDQLLSSFYKMEVPSELSNPPSSWPEIQQAAKPVALKASTTIQHKPAPSTGRAIAVIASLAACMMFVALTNLSEGDAVSGNGTMAVSGESQTETGIVDPEVETTMEEVDGFQFESGESEPDSVAEPKTETEK